MSSFHKAPNVFADHVTIKVKDLSTSLRFYQEIIGLQVLHQSDRMAVLTADGKTGLVTLEQPLNVRSKPERTTGLYHFALLLPTRKDLSVFLRHLLETKYPIGASDHYVSEAIYLNDPDGNGIEVYRDRSASEWTWEEGLVNMATVALDGKGLLSESTEPWTGLPAGTILGHMHLHVNNLEEAKEFYTKGLGFEVVAYYPQAVFLSTGGYHHHIAINTWQGTGATIPPDNSVGLASFRLVFPSEQARRGVVHNLQSIGVSVTSESSSYVVVDPGGNTIELMV